MPDFAFSRTFPECHCRIRVKAWKAAWWNQSHEHIRRAAWLRQMFWPKPKRRENLYLELD